jgi:hypothetical protein
MGHIEFQPLQVIENAVSGRLNVCEASRLLQLSERQWQRLNAVTNLVPSIVQHRNIRPAIVLIVFAFLALSTPSQ